MDKILTRIIMKIDPVIRDDLIIIRRGIRLFDLALAGLMPPKSKKLFKEDGRSGR